MGTTVMKFVGGITYGPNTFTFPQVVATQVAITGDGTGATCLVQRYDNLTNGSFLTLKKTRGSVAAPLAVNSGDTCGGVSYQGYGGTNNRDIATIVCYVDTYTSDTNISGGLLFSTNGGSTGVTERMRIDSSGNVGIGTSSPTRKLTAYTSAADDNVILVKSAAGNAYLGFADNATTDQSGLSVRIGSAGNAMLFSTGGTSERMRIDSSGNVGIGTSSPSCTLALNGAGATGGQIQILKSGALQGNIYGTGTAFRIENTSSTPIVFIQNTGAEYMRIDSSGNVGIGTSSPANKLDLFGDNTYIAQRAHSSAQSNGGVWSMASTFWSTPTYTGTGIQQYGSAAAGTTAGLANANLGVLKFQNGSGALIYTNTETPIVFANIGLERMRIDPSGNVGIGTSSPNASAILDAQSTTKGVRFPNMTTTQKTAISSPAAGLVVFDTTLAKLCVYSGAAWQTITSI
jgi:hypothetical protein